MEGSKGRALAVLPVTVHNPEATELASALVFHQFGPIRTDF